MKLAVIVTDARASVHIGGNAETTVRVFDLPPEVVEYIEAAKRLDYTSVSLATTDEGDSNG